jgi:DNA-binding MurR/RpiR family transcriptional regulator
MVTDGGLERALADEPEVFAFGSLGQVGRKFDVTQATILRFAQAMGYSGYAALQEAVRRAYPERVGPIRVRAAAVRRLDSVSSRHRADVQQLHQTIRASEVGMAARLVLQARRRLATGAEAMGDMAPLLVAQLRHAELPAHVLRSAGPGIPALPGDVGRGDVLVAVGVCARAAATAWTLSEARTRGARTIAITDSPAGPVAAAATVTLVAPAAVVGSACSVVATAALIDLLMTEVVAQQEEHLHTGMALAVLGQTS